MPKGEGFGGGRILIRQALRGPRNGAASSAQAVAPATPEAVLATPPCSSSLRGGRRPARQSHGAGKWRAVNLDVAAPTPRLPRAAARPSQRRNPLIPGRQRLAVRWMWIGASVSGAIADLERADIGGKRRTLALAAQRPDALVCRP